MLCGQGVMARLELLEVEKWKWRNGNGEMEVDKWKWISESGEMEVDK